MINKYSLRRTQLKGEWRTHVGTSVYLATNMLFLPGYYLARIMPLCILF